MIPLVNQPPPPLDFEANERDINRHNLAEVAEEVANRSERLATRIYHFATQFGVPKRTSGGPSKRTLKGHWRRPWPRKHDDKTSMKLPRLIT